VFAIHGSGLKCRPPPHQSLSQPVTDKHLAISLSVANWSAIGLLIEQLVGFVRLVQRLTMLKHDRPVVGCVGSAVGSVVGGILYVLVDNSAQAISL